MNRERSLRESCRIFEEKVTIGRKEVGMRDEYSKRVKDIAEDQG